jgi:hypothetical protein
MHEGVENNNKMIGADIINARYEQSSVDTPYFAALYEKLRSE